MKSYWSCLCDKSNVVDKVIATLKDGHIDIMNKIHSGGNTYIQINLGYQCVTIRKFDSITNDERLNQTNEAEWGKRQRQLKTNIKKKSRSS